MPNWVTNKIEFEADEQKANAVYDAMCINGKINFNTLIPTPLHVYQGDLGSEDEKDFGDNTWSSWNRANWGTKWNACSPEKLRYENGKACIVFDTAWTVPYPVVIAFLNNFRLPCTLKYFDECHNFWGIETFAESDGVMRRTSKRDTIKEDEVSLYIELKGYDPNEDNDD